MNRWGISAKRKTGKNMKQILERVLWKQYGGERAMGEVRTLLQEAV